MICLKCNTTRSGFSGRLCPVCSEPLVSETREAEETLILNKLKIFLTKWKNSGKIGPKTFDEINSAIESESKTPAVKIETHSEPYQFLFFTWIAGIFEAFFAGFTGIFEPMLVEKSSHGKRKHRKGDSEYSTSNLFSDDSDRLSGIEALSELGKHSKKHGKEEEFVFWAGLKPLFNEYLWWFIGSLLVLTGSIMGIREAWMVLSGTGRLLTVIAALYLYQALFTGLGLFLSRKSVMTGRLLSVIALLLIPVSFSVLADVFLLDIISGIVTLSLEIGLLYLLFIVIGKQFNLNSLELSLPILPSMIALALIPFFAEGIFAIGLLFVPHLSLVFTEKAIYKNNKTDSRGLILLSLYGAVSVIIIFINSVSTRNPLSFSAGSLHLGVLWLWGMGLSYILSSVFNTFHANSSSTKIFAVLEIVFLAIVLTIASTAGISLFLTNVPNMEITAARSLYMSVLVIGSFIFYMKIPHFIPAIHPFMVLSIAGSFLIAQEFLSIPGWKYALFPIVPVLGLLLYNKTENPLRNILAGWGISIGFLSNFILLFFNAPQEIFYPLVFSGLLFLTVLHFTGRNLESGFHYIAGFGTFSALQGIFYGYPASSSIAQLALIFGILGILYSVIGVWSAKLKKETGDYIRPFDDLALLATVFFFFTILFVSARTTRSETLFFLITSIIIVFRSFIDKSKLVSFLGFLLIGIAGLKYGINDLSYNTISGSIFVSSAIAFGFTLFTGVFPFITIPDPPKSRKVFYVIRLPFPSEDLSLLRDGLMASTAVFIVYAVGLMFQWFTIADQPERNLVIISGILLSLAFLIAFFSRSFFTIQLRGSSITLFLIFFCIGLTAVANRIGRPLPPSVVGINLTLGIIAVWIFSRVLFKYGPFLAEWLNNPIHGKYYHFIPLYTMLLLAFVLLVDALLIGSPTALRFLYVTPPTFFIGSGIALLLYAWSIEKSYPIFLAPGLFLVAFMLVFSQGSIRGTELIPLDPPGGRWVPTLTLDLTRTRNWLDPNLFLPAPLTPFLLLLRATTGIAAAGAVYALLAVFFPLPMLISIFKKANFRSEEIFLHQSSFVFWTLVSAGLITLITFWYAFIDPAVILFVAGGFLLFSGYFRKTGTKLIGFSILLIVQGVAHLSPVFPLWTGPLLAFLGLLLVLVLFPIRSNPDIPYSQILEKAHVGAFIYTFAGCFYALAAFSPTNPENAVPGLLSGTLNGIFGNWILSLALGATLGIASLSLLVGSFQWTKILSTAGAFSGTILTAITFSLTFPVVCGPAGVCDPASNPMLLLFQMLPYFALITSGIAAISFYSSGYLEKRREDISFGFIYASDSLIVTTGLLLAVIVRTALVSSLQFANYVTLISILLIILITSVASVNTLKPRYLYFLQTAIGSLYLSLKPAFPQFLTSEVDAVVALLFGFILTGVTSVAQKLGVPPLAESTRRFAALMPVLAVIVLPTETSYQNAGIATFSAILYSALGIVSSHRIYTVLAAISANLAIFLAIMASNVTGIEVYLAPIGLFSLLLGHIFRENLSELTKKAIRIVGGLFLYLPAAVNISLEIGRADDAFYSLVFGVICLLGVAAGMLFQIRSYLFMGVTFFTLDITVNLLQTGLRDQRMGFVLLSLTGISIIGGLVYYTINKEKIQKRTEKLKKVLAHWES